MDENGSWGCPAGWKLENGVVPLKANVVRVSLQMSNRSNYFKACAWGHLGDCSLKAWPPSSCSSALPFSLRESAVLALGNCYQDDLWQGSGAEQEERKAGVHAHVKRPRSVVRHRAYSCRRSVCLLRFMWGERRLGGLPVTLFHSQSQKHGK